MQIPNVFSSAATAEEFATKCWRRMLRNKHIPQLDYTPEIRKNNENTRTHS